MMENEEKTNLNTEPKPGQVWETTRVFKDRFEVLARKEFPGAQGPILVLMWDIEGAEMSEPAAPIESIWLSEFGEPNAKRQAKYKLIKDVKS